MTLQDCIFSLPYSHNIFIYYCKRFNRVYHMCVVNLIYCFFSMWLCIFIWFGGCLVYTSFGRYFGWWLFFVIIQAFFYITIILRGLINTSRFLIHFLLPNAIWSTLSLPDHPQRSYSYKSVFHDLIYSFFPCGYVQHVS